MVLTRSQRPIFGVSVNELTENVGSFVRSFPIKRWDLHLEILMA